MAETDERGEDLLTLEDVAILLSHTDHVPAHIALKLPRVIGTDRRFAAQVEELRAMAREAGIGPERRDWPDAALHCHRDFERLLAAGDWRDAAEVLDPRGEVGVSYRELARLAASRARGTDDPRLAEIRAKLERAWAAEKERGAPVRRIVAEILERDPETARHLLNQAFVEYKRRRGPASA